MYFKTFSSVQFCNMLPQRIPSCTDFGAGRTNEATSFHMFGLNMCFHVTHFSWSEATLQAIPLSSIVPPHVGHDEVIKLWGGTDISLGFCIRAPHLEKNFLNKLRLVIYETIYFVVSIGVPMLIAVNNRRATQFIAQGETTSELWYFA